MEYFLTLLKRLEDDELIEESEFCLSQEIPIVSEISHLADDLLITQSGYCNWENIYYVEDSGYDVFPLERDGFGWLLGGIQTKKGIIAYG